MSYGHARGHPGLVQGFPAVLCRLISSTLSPAHRAGYTEGVDPRHARGRTAEAEAAQYLEGQGLHIVARNVRLPEGEIDLVCRDGPRWVFVEVKCRRARWGDAPGAAVTWHKQRRLVRLAQHYLKWQRIERAPCRFDVVAVTLDAEGRSQVCHIPAAFDATGLA
jgi:putative endonuclease